MDADARFCDQCGAAACETCKAPLDADAAFCDQCGTPVSVKSPPEPSPQAPEQPATTTGGGGRIALSVLVGGAALVTGIMRLNDDSRAPQFEVIETPPIVPPDRPEPKSLREQAPSRPPTELERSVAGTWVASSPPPIVDANTMVTTMASLEAIQAGAKPQMPQPCLWLELYDNLTGYQHECAVIDGEPSVFDQQTFGSPVKRAVGVSFTWSFDERIELVYDQPMTTPPGAGPRVEVRSVTLDIVPGTQPIEARLAFPEHPSMRPKTLHFEAFAGAYLGDTPSDVSPGAAGLTP